MKMEETAARCERCAKLVDWFLVDGIRDPEVRIRRCSYPKCGYYGRLDILAKTGVDNYAILATVWVKQPPDMVEFASAKEMMR